MTSLRRASRTAAAAASLSILLLSLFPAGVSAATASITQTANTDCAAGVVEFQLDVTGLNWGETYAFEFGFKPDGSGGYAEYRSWAGVTIGSSGAWSMLVTLTGQTVSGGEVADLWAWSMWTFQEVARTSTTLQCAPPAPPAPTSLADCLNGGWTAWPGFKTQGDCVSFVMTGGRNLPAASTTRSSR